MCWDKQIIKADVFGLSTKATIDNYFNLQKKIQIYELARGYWTRASSIEQVQRHAVSQFFFRS